MRLGFHYHVPATTKNGAIYMPAYLGCFIDSLAEYCESIMCFQHSPTEAEKYLLDYKIQSPHVRLVDLGIHASVPKRLLRSYQSARIIKKNIADLDILLLRAPTPLLPVFAKAAGGLPTALLLVGDNLSGVDEIRQPLWRKELIRLLWRWNKSQQTRLAKHSLTFVNSHKLYDELKDSIPYLAETRTTTLRQSDFYEREDTCLSPPYHLLYTGRIEKAKGLFELVDAVALLVENKQDVVLDIVGWAIKGDPIVDELKDLARKKEIRERVVFHGFKSLGEELSQTYKKADLYVLASYAEGFPRTIWEAMAHSLPVVATRVGSIPSRIEGVAELVEPKNTRELAFAIKRLLNKSTLRKEYIWNGFALAKENTLENQTEKLVMKMESWLQYKNASHNKEKK